MIECFRISDSQILFAFDKECGKVGDGISQWYEMEPSQSASKAILEIKRRQRDDAYNRIQRAADRGLPKTAIEAAADYAKAMAEVAHYEVVDYVVYVRHCILSCFRGQESAHGEVELMEAGLRSARRWTLCNTEKALADIVRDLTGDKLLSSPKVWR